MTFCTLDPVADQRWKSFLDCRVESSIFHTPGWLEALRRTYAYQPVVYAKLSKGKDITSAQVFCQVDSWITGRRLVSVPFSDHAAILLETPDDLQELLAVLRTRIDQKNYRYVELRPTTAGGEIDPFLRSRNYYSHRLLLNADLDEIYRGFHKNCVQRKIRRAEREQLDYAEGRSEKLIQQFHRLLLNTHRRHGLPPQPISWFRNLAACLGPSFKIRIASYRGKPIAGIVTLLHKKTVVYKYGGSDSKYHRFGGMAFLFWKTIQEAKTCGYTALDMGRSDCDNLGLVNFKEHWGAQRSILTYLRYPEPSPSSFRHRWELKLAQRIVDWIPEATLVAAGKHLYRHVG